MPCHPDRVRGNLPLTYQFGDGRALVSSPHTHWYTSLIGDDSVCRCGDRWRPMHENAADRLKRYQTEFETDRDCGDERAT